MWAGWLSVTHGTTVTVTYLWTSPGAATHDAQGWHYTKLIQKQADISWQLALRVTLPSCAHAVTALGGGLALVANHRGGAAISEPLTQDSTYSIAYTC